MPGIIVFQRRWGVGSDDLVVPGISLTLLHAIWLIVVAVTLGLDNGSVDHACESVLRLLLIIKTALLGVSLLLEIFMARLALRGTMWDVHPRRFMEYVLYSRLLVLVAEMVWSSFSIVWLHGSYITCPAGMEKEVLLGSVICDLCVALSVLITIWCTFDRAGRSWVKMTRFQRSMKEGETKYHYKRSGNHRPNWRQRKVMRTYQDTWNHRCKILFCCMGRSDQYQDSFSEIARLLTDFFRDLDLVPTDIVAGLVLLRKQQKKLQETLVTQDQNDIYEFLSGVAVTSRTRFLSLHEPDQLEAFQLTEHYMKFALAAYGWPMYLLGHSKTGLCRLVSNIRCCCCCGSGSTGSSESGETLPVIVGDTCSGCHLAALKQSIGRVDHEVIFASFHVDVAETPFFVAIDYDHQSVVVSIRGTISMKDVITDLHAEAEPIPLQLTREDWFGHKGMVQTATYIRNKLEKENLLGKAFAHNPERGTPDFRLVLVGHSLGAGTAAILALLLRHEYPHVHCYAYSPPGGLLSLPAAEFTKEFVTSIVVGKDVVPRLGLHQLETLRSSLMTAINKSTNPKWKILGSSMLCCGRRNKDAAVKISNSPVVSIEEGGGGGSKDVPSTTAVLTKHPSDTNISLSTHQPLYPPGRIIHIVRQHPKASDRQVLLWLSV
ncbi:hypothetical protein DAPPUDRAFT_58603 [Daphnia pulex]|uniref:Diacylglycerol lipase-alpha n=1 Tax=Daphnia pulex TaxID=6669 RepID=E9H669_DAPPU|nr:hypothetical protein DAPPUDRAFT_58603 [Daphnia pulex]|eukprot:EFX72758.1 hypothetical protein DAPPUDRAFT_58603 [Daphnia pulex]